MIPVALAAETAEVATESANFLQNIDWTRPTWDLFIILFFIVAAFLYGLSLGRDRIIIILISVYTSLAVVEHAPLVNNKGFQDMINNFVGQFFVFQISAFVVLFVLLFFIITRSALLKTIASSDSPGPWWQVFMYSILHVGLLVSIILSYIPKESLEGVLAPLTMQVFTTNLAQNIWIIGPLIAMFVFKGGASAKKKRQYTEEIE